jgi:LemA protein
MKNKNKKGGAGTIVLITLGIVFLLLFFVGVFIAGSYNGLVSTDTNVEQKWGNVQTSYERRLDLIPNLVETVKGVSNFEKDTQTQIAAFRAGIQNAKTPAQLDEVGKQMNQLVSGIAVSVEAYPDLKSSQNFLALQDELAGTENRISWERNNYNEAVKSYKTKVRTFPTNIIAGMFGFDLSKWDMFEASDGADTAPKVKF